MSVNEELKHYGVLGMKWGISRSKEVRGVKKAYKNQKRDIRYNRAHEYDKLDNKWLADTHKAELKGKSYKEASDKWDGAYKKLHAKYETKNKQVDSQYKKDLAAAKEKAADRLFRDGDSARNHRIANMNLGKALLQSFLMSSYGAKKYNQYRAKDQGRLESGVKGWLWGAGNAIGYQIPTSVSNGRFAANYTKDVINNNPQLRKLKDNVKNSPQVRKGQDKVNEYKSKLKKKVSR